MQPAAEQSGPRSDESVRSVHRAFSLLSVFGPEQPRASLSQLARESGLPVTTVSRLLTTLELLGFVRRLEDGRYGLGVRVLQLGFAARQTFDIIDVAEPLLVEINQASGENTNLAVRRDERSFTYIRQLATRHPVRHASWVGRTQPLAGTANGAALRGKVGPRGYVATRKTIEPDISAVAAPVRGPGSEIVAAISVTAPTYRTSDATLAEYGRLVVDAANRLSKLLSGAREEDRAAPLRKRGSPRAGSSNAVTRGKRHAARAT
jgi:IclR family transcriptional regulator, acetate operon repressor